MTVGEVNQIIAAINRWSPEDRAWWITLLRAKPKEAVRVGIVAARLDAYPVRDEAL